MNLTNEFDILRHNKHCFLLGFDSPNYMSKSLLRYAQLINMQERQ